MTGSGGWAAGLIGAIAIAAASFSAADAANISDMKACAAVGSTAVRLACFDAAAKSVKKGDTAACAAVKSEAVRLACFDAIAGRAGARTASSPAPSSGTDMARMDREVRAREAAMKARIEKLRREAAEVERRTAEIERRTAALNGGSKPEASPVEKFGSRDLGDKQKKTAQANFGDEKAETDDPLTAKTYSETAQKDDNNHKPKRIDRITARITNVHQGPYGKIRVTLANGQIWKQVDSTRARWNKRGENTAQIRRAFLGSFLMTINDTGAALRVHRVK